MSVSHTGTAELATREQVERLVPQVVEQARAIVVDSPEAYEEAGTFLQLIAERRRLVGETFDPIVSKAHAAHKEAVAQRAKFLDPLNTAERDVKGKLAGYVQEQQRIQREAQRRLEEEARQAAETAAAEEAKRLEAAGETELAAMVREEAAQAPAPVVPVASAVPRMAGIANRETWKWRFKGSEAAALRELVQAAAKDERLLGYLAVRETAVGSTVRAQKSLTKIPGIEVYPDQTVAVSTR